MFYELGFVIFNAILREKLQVKRVQQQNIDKRANTHTLSRHGAPPLHLFPPLAAIERVQAYS